MKLSAAMIEALKFMAGNNGTSIGPGCPSTDATFQALRKRRMVWRNCNYYELTKAGADATL